MISPFRILLAISVLTLFSCKTQDLAKVQKIIPTDKNITESTVNVNTIKGHIYFLASDELAGRDTPSPELNIAARYLATTLERYGVKKVLGADSYLQKVPMKKVTPATTGTIKVGTQTFNLPSDFLLLSGEDIDLKGEILFLQHGTEADFEKGNVKDKIIVTLAGYEGQSNPQEWFYAGREKQERGNKYGVKAIVEIYSNAQLPWAFLLQFFNQPRTMVDDTTADEDGTPYIWVNAGDPAAIADLKKNGSQGTITVTGSKEEMVETYNVVGMVAGSDPAVKDEYVIYSAHYDHIGRGAADASGDTIYNGARDNAVGSVTVLSAAENISKNPTRRSALFIFFTGEEKGLLGSAYYADHPMLPLDKAIYCFNSDNAGYNDTSRVTIIGLTRTHAQPLIEKACAAFGLNAKEDEVPEQGLFDRSDNVNFAAKGVPAPTFSMGLTSFDEVINRYYHQAADGPETLDYEYLEKFFKSYVYACRLIGNTDQSVFWKEGDKYFEAGEALYKK